MIVSDDDRARIAAAVTLAEQKTSGEIVVVLAKEIAKYDEVPLGWASAAALLAPAALLLAGRQFLNFTHLDWVAAHAAAIQQNVVVALWTLLAAQIVLFIIVHTLASWRPVRRVLTPRWLKRARAKSAAMAQFLATGLDGSANRTGVVIFIALEEHVVEVVADALINAMVREEAWIAITDVMQMHLKRNELALAVEAGVLQCEILLEKHFPQNGDRFNALPDAPKIV